MIKNLRLSNKLILSFLLPAIFFIAIGGYFSYTINKNKLENQVLASLSLLAKTKRDYLMTFLDFNKGRMADWSSDGYIRDSFEKIIKNKDKIDVSNLTGYIKTKKQILDPEIIISDIIDVEGVILVSTIHGRVGMRETVSDLDNEYNFTKAKNAEFGQTFLSSMVVEDEPGHSMKSPMWHVSTPLVSLISEKVIGVMVNHISNNKLIRVFKENQQAVGNNIVSEVSSPIAKGNTLEIYLVDVRKLMLTPSRFVENAILNQVVDTEPVRKCHETGKDMSGIYNDYRGVSVFGASACIDSSSHWTLLAEIDESEIIAQLNYIKIIVAVLSIFVFLGSVLLVYFLNKIIVRPIKELSGLMNKITGDHLFQKIREASKDEIGELETAFNEMSKRIEEEDRAKSEFVSLASHQLLTPLTTISWITELLEHDNKNLNDKQKEFLRDIHRVDGEMIGLVRALLDVSRIELGTFSIEPEAVNLADVADSILLEIQLMVKEKNIKIIKDYHGILLPVIEGDPKLLRIIFQNLLTNAVKYTPNGGKITIGLLIKKEGILITVSDSGYGIPKNDYLKVFSKFYRGENVKQKELGGTGLGLYIVKSIVDNAGGKIWFESPPADLPAEALAEEGIVAKEGEENKGTIFYVSFPPEGMVKKEGVKQLGA